MSQQNVKALEGKLEEVVRRTVDAFSLVDEGLASAQLLAEEGKDNARVLRSIRAGLRGLIRVRNANGDGASGQRPEGDNQNGPQTDLPGADQAADPQGGRGDGQAERDRDSRAGPES